MRWLVDALHRNGVAALTGYASSLTAAARWASEHGIALDGVVAYPSSEPVTVGKLAGDAGLGHEAVPDLRVRSRRHDGPELRRVRRRGVPPLGPRARGDHPPPHTGRRHRSRTRSCSRASRPRPRVCWSTSRTTTTASCDPTSNARAGLAALGLRTRISDIRGISKVVAAGISLDGDDVRSHWWSVELPDRVGGGAGDYQFVEQRGAERDDDVAPGPSRYRPERGAPAATPSTRCCARPTTVCWRPRCGSATAASPSNGPLRSSPRRARPFHSNVSVTRRGRSETETKT